MNPALNPRKMFVGEKLEDELKSVKDKLQQIRIGTKASALIESGDSMVTPHRDPPPSFRGSLDILE
ncbi:hypothetical protein D3C78_1394020 [compost metagenome]